MSHPSSLTWFRFHASDLGALAWLGFRAHLLRCGECRERCERELTERRALAPAEPAPRAPFVLRLGAPAFVLATCAAVVWQVSAHRAVPEPIAMNDEPELFRPKGGAVFEILVTHRGEQAPLGLSCHEGDVLQARYSAPGAPLGKYLLVVGLDPHGAARVLFPLDGKVSQTITPGPNLVPNSWVLDAELGRERFVAFFSDTELRAEDALRSARVDTPHLPGVVTKVSECFKVAR